jgi:predicted acetyltransferase
MAITLSKMDVEVADWTTVQSILKDNYEIWSAGLGKNQYYHYIYQHLTCPWGRKNLSYFALRKKNEVLASCKLYNLEFQAYNKTYKVGGLGAVFTPERHRCEGYGSTLIEKMVEKCRRQDYDALFLFSDIEPEFYVRLGFEPLGHEEFRIGLANKDVVAAISSDPGFIEDADSMDSALLELDQVPMMVSHYSRWLPARSYGVKRSPDYWHYKLWKEKYLLEHSKANRPQLELVTVNAGQSSGGYAIYEQSPEVLRVLEIVGSEPAVESLWRHILATALLVKVSMVRGWESLTPSLPGPVRGVKYQPRKWAFPMMLCLNRQVESWLEKSPCPVLELDHF